MLYTLFVTIVLNSGVSSSGVIEDNLTFDQCARAVGVISDRVKEFHKNEIKHNVKYSSRIAYNDSVCYSAYGDSYFNKTDIFYKSDFHEAKVEKQVYKIY